MPDETLKRGKLKKMPSQKKLITAVAMPDKKLRKILQEKLKKIHDSASLRKAVLYSYPYTNLDLFFQIIKLLIL